MNHIELGTDEVVICGDEDIVIPTVQFMLFAEGIYNEYDVRVGSVSMDVAEDMVYFFTNDGLTEVDIPMHHALEIAMHLL